MGEHYSEMVDYCEKQMKKYDDENVRKFWENASFGFVKKWFRAVRTEAEKVISEVEVSE